MIEAIKESLEKATPGPWEASETDEGHQIKMATALETPWHHDSHHEIQYGHYVFESDGAQYVEAAANAHLIANTPTYISYLLDELEKANEQWRAFSILSSDQQKSLEIMTKEHTTMKEALERQGYDDPEMQNYDARADAKYVLSTLKCID